MGDLDLLSRPLEIIDPLIVQEIVFLPKLSAITHGTLISNPKPITRPYSGKTEKKINGAALQIFLDIKIHYYTLKY